MKLLENIYCTKGITLNSQLVDLLSILDESIPKEEQDKKIIEYIESLRETEKQYNEAIAEGRKFEYVVNTVIDSLDGISDEDKKKIKDIYLDSLSNLSVCNKEKMMQKLAENGLNPDLHTEIASKNKVFTAKEGILTLTPEKVRKLYDHMFKSKNTYDRVTFDNVGKYSGYVSFDGETYTPDKLEKMIGFCEKHGMKSKINTLMFYADFPNVLEASLDVRVKSGQISEEDKKQILKKSLIDYAVDIGRRYGDRIDAVDIFNELIYDPVMKEPGFDEESTFHPRKEGWQKYLGLEDLCEMALAARKEMPNVTFTYNDMNWANPEKRKEIIKVIKKIQTIEARYRAEGKLGPDEKGLIDTIGIEAHLTTDVDLDEIDKIFEDIEREIGLPVEVTEFDVARTGENPLSPEEIRKQGKFFEKFMKLAQERPELISFTIWSQSDELSFMNDKCQRMVYASLLDSNFEEKDFETSREFVPQNFNFHTHTALCGHADGTIEEYILKAIEGGITKLGFSDHTPSLLGKSTPGSEMTMEEFETQYIPILLELRKKYAEKIDIKIGLESEYYGDELESLSLSEIPEEMLKYSGILQTLKASREKTESNLDYLILGQHSALARDGEGKIIMPPKRSDKNSSRYPLDYAQTVVEAIKSGKFAYVAHPDIFLEARDEVPESEKEEYRKNSIIATEMICEAAKEYGIPLEVNLGSISAVEAGIKEKMKDGSYAYPVPEFWKIAQEKGCKVLIGTDAHSPEVLKDKKCERIAREILDGIDLEYLQEFEPNGIGKEGKKAILFTPESVGKAFANRSVAGKDEARGAFTEKIVINTIDSQLHDDE